MSTGVGLPELNTTMITGALVQLSNDPRLFRFHNPARTRRLLFYLSFFVGCSVGATVVRGREAWPGLLLTALVKAVVAVSLLWNQGIESLPRVEEETTEGGGRWGAASLMSMIIWGE
ncbi:hypothetical protein B0A55_12819 [Friedmanniomyces simplex]|uniref:Uncharacterized protein n=1 Tax=Friedmanniomyces simplex TaxID=329884 RepID=A0A4U0WAU5_9PEZI|nr:hypothetical protein B0A55_12819 [Friedmanniomyces simplex]